jgi:hypothetical protein
VAEVGRSVSIRSFGAFYMRRAAVFGLLLLLPGCSTFSDFLGDTFSYNTNPNRPVGNSENMRRVMGVDTSSEPLTPEPGDIWPTTIQSTPTLQDLEKQSGPLPTPGPEQLTPYAPDHRQPRPGSSSPPFSVQPGLPPIPNPGPQPAAPTVSVPAPPASGQVIQTPTGPGVTSGGGSGYQTLTTPGGTAIVVPNGNGTSTVIRPDGSVQTVPSPR